MPKNGFKQNHGSGKSTTLPLSRGTSLRLKKSSTLPLKRGTGLRSKKNQKFGIGKKVFFWGPTSKRKKFNKNSNLKKGKNSTSKFKKKSISKMAGISVSKKAISDSLRNKIHSCGQSRF